MNRIIILQTKEKRYQNSLPSFVSVQTNPHLVRKPYYTLSIPATFACIKEYLIKCRIKKYLFTNNYNEDSTEYNYVNMNT